jgi:xanthine dehydrogenase small subunit
MSVPEIMSVPEMPSAEPVRRHLRFRFRGLDIALDAFDPRRTLLDWLREDRRATGTKEGCAEGDCGACTIILRRLVGGQITHEPVNACILLLGQVDGAEILTVEDLAQGGALHPVQQAMVEHHGSQCGFCTPGIVMSLAVLHETGSRPVSRQAVDDALAGNLCRCTGYRPIVDAAFAAMEARPCLIGDEIGTRDALAGLVDDRDLFVGDESRFFAAPATLDAACALAQSHPDATILAGATDIGLWITKALRDLPRVIWLGRVAELKSIVETGDHLHLGAMVSHAGAMEHLARLDPDLGELMRRFGSPQVRASGTVGGNIANGSPIGDLAPALIALGARLHLRHGTTTRTLPLEDFFIAYRKQDRLPGELVTGLDVPRPGADVIFRCYKVSKRFDEDISAVMAAFALTISAGKVAGARIACGGMAGTPKRALHAEAALAGASLDDPETWRPALDALALDYDPLTDQRASSAYRRDVARNLLRKALMESAGAPAASTRLIGHREAAHV